MEFQAADPAPFIPDGYARQEVQGTTFMVQAFARWNLQHNNNVAIITMDPLPQHQVPFTEIRDDIV
jgi:hypothetical protein